MPFELFERKTSRVTSPAITLSPEGRIGVNSAATELFMRDNVEFVYILWDRETRRMAIRPTMRKDARAFRITYNKNKSSAAIAAKSFMDHIGYNYSDRQTYAAEWDEKEGMIIELPAERMESAQKVVPMESQRRSNKVGFNR
jgi:hypothetical protein